MIRQGIDEDIKKMADSYMMTEDLHTHTLYSKGRFKKHATGTIEENVQAAFERGLEGVAITEHGPEHIFYGMDRKKLPEMREEICRLRPLYPKLKIFLSVEADIYNKGYGLDVRPEEAGNYDFIIAGYHFGTRDACCVSNWIAAKTGSRRMAKKLAFKNTDMIIKALYENDIKVLTHPGDKAFVYMDQIAKACADTNTLMEISTWHAHLTVDEIKTASKEDVSFIISSDAHKPERVGTFKGGLVRAFKAALDPERIVNIRRIEEQ